MYGFQRLPGAALSRRALLAALLLWVFLSFAGCSDIEPRRVATSAAFNGTVNASFVTAQASALHWVRDSSEYRAVALTIYRAAASTVASLPDQCDVAKAIDNRPWIVVMDADETLLDNSIYQLQLLAAGAQSTSASWNEWVGRKREMLVPGARDFVQAVATKCGRIAVVTNRKNKSADPIDECATTRARFRELFDDVKPSNPIVTVLCADVNGAEVVRDKNARFQRIRDGLVPELGRVDIAMYIGDSITDFPALRPCNVPSAIDALGDRFGTNPRVDPDGGRIASYFQLPNPMYGGWPTCAQRPIVDDVSR